MRMLHGNLKVKFPVAGGEAIYAAIFSIIEIMLMTPIP